MHHPKFNHCTTELKVGGVGKDIRQGKKGKEQNDGPAHIPSTKHAQATAVSQAR